MSRAHFVGIGGVGMGTFAVALAKEGTEITGSDGALYEPMKGVLERSQIKLIEGFKPETASQLNPDFVVIGNVVRRDNPEVQAWLQKGVKFLSFPEAVRTLLIKDKVSVVCSGTHGKTTTTSWLAFLFSELGLEPSYLIGGVPRDLPSGCMSGSGNLCVVEGDEYDSAFFDKGPKFLHYNPKICICSSIEFDHADIYRDLAHVRASFEKLVSLLPGDGLFIGRYDDPVVMEVAPLALCPVQTFGVGNGAMWKLGAVSESPDGIEFEVLYKGRSVGKFLTPLFGEHNLMNLISGMIAAVNLGVAMDRIRPIVPKFRGARRRQEILARKPVNIVDDFAHHPTEVGATLKGVRKRYTTGKLWALFEPRSATARRNVHQNDYVKAFDGADEILVTSAYRAGELKDSERFSAEQLVADLNTTGKHARCLESADAIVEIVKKEIHPGDTILIMSNGEFGKIQAKLLSALSAE